MKWEYRSLRKSTTYHNQLNGNEYVLEEDFFVLIGAFTQQGIDNILITLFNLIIFILFY